MAGSDDDADADMPDDDAQSSFSSPSTSYTIKSVQGRAVAREKKRALIQEAVAWCRANGKGARSALRTGSFAGETKAEVHNELKRGDREIVRDHHNQILTNEEASSRAHMPSGSVARNADRNRANAESENV